MSTESWYIQYSNQIIASIGIIVAIIIGYVGLKHQQSKIGVEKSSSQFQQIEKANTVIQTQINVGNVEKTRIRIDNGKLIIEKLVENKDDER